MKTVPILLLCSALAAAAAPEFKPRRVVKAFDPITNPEVVAVDKAGDFVRDNELILGVAIGDEARAYPINMLTRPMREIINDRLGGRSIAATW